MMDQPQEEARQRLAGSPLLDSEITQRVRMTIALSDAAPTVLGHRLRQWLFRVSGEARTVDRMKQHYLAGAELYRTAPSGKPIRPEDIAAHRRGWTGGMGAWYFHEPSSAVAFNAFFADFDIGWGTNRPEDIQNLTKALHTVCDELDIPQQGASA